jgi:hypothetical protein
MTEHAYTVVITSTDTKIERVVDGDSKKSGAFSKSSSSLSVTNPTATLSNPGDTKNCGDFVDYHEAKAWYDTYFRKYGDVARLDGDGNGIPCESLPGAPKKAKK